MQAAAQLSLPESAAIDWLMRKNLEKADYAAALYYADAFLRTRPQFIDYVMPTLVRMAEDKTANQPLKTLLVDDPPWRGSFFPCFQVAYRTRARRWICCWHSDGLRPR